MMYAFAAAAIVIGLAVILRIVARKFPQLSLIDTEALPLERDAKRKKAIIKNRVDRMTGAFGRRIAAACTSRFERFRERFRATYRKLLALERQMRKEKEKPVAPAEADARIAALAAEAERLRKAEEYGEAEKKYIEILTIDQRNADAYWGLGALYVEAKRLEQAVETFSYLSRMLRKDSRCAHAESGEAAADRPCEASAAIHADIAAAFMEAGRAAQSLGNAPEVRQWFERAVAFEPANPRHLDLLLDACILEGDKSRANEVFARLAEVNPENNKLDSFAGRIAAIPEPQAPARKGRNRVARPAA